jgi:hypothetical protein
VGPSPRRMGSTIPLAHLKRAKGGQSEAFLKAVLMPLWKLCGELTEDLEPPKQLPGQRIMGLSEEHLM